MKRIFFAVLVTLLLSMSAIAAPLNVGSFNLVNDLINPETNPNPTVGWQLQVYWYTGGIFEAFTATPVTLTNAHVVIHFNPIGEDPGFVLQSVDPSRSISAGGGGEPFQFPTELAPSHDPYRSNAIPETDPQGRAYTPTSATLTGTLSSAGPWTYSRNSRSGLFRPNSTDFSYTIALNGWAQSVNDVFVPGSDVPEPASLLLLGGGLLCAFTGRRFLQ